MFTSYRHPPRTNETPLAQGRELGGRRTRSVRHSLHTTEVLAPVEQPPHSRHRPSFSQGRTFGRRERGTKTVRIFSRMSSEAQTAINETRREMGLPLLSKEATRFLQQQRQQNTTSQPNVLLSTKARDGFDLAGTRDMSGSRDLVFSRDVNTRPRLTHRDSSNDLDSNPERPPTPPQRDHSDLNARSPGFDVGGAGPLDRPPLHPEMTFEITPPGFDIRFRDVIIMNTKLDETPEDIIAKSVRKCHEWLAKYL